MKEQIAKLEAERTVLYDRLGLIGLGGPLFTVPVQPVDPDAKEAPDLVDPDELYRRVLALKGNPRAQRREIHRQRQEAIKQQSARPSVARIPDMSKVASINEAMDQAEAAGRKQA